MNKEEYNTTESFKFIDNNLNILSDDLPSKFAKKWIVDDFDAFLTGKIIISPYDYRFIIFSYAYLKVLGKHGHNSVLEIDPRKLYDHFMSFQIILNIKIIKENLNMPFDGIKIFDFKNYDNILKII